MSKLYFCGPAGRVEYFDTSTSTWHDMSFSSSFDGNCIHGTGPDNIWVGTRGYYAEDYMELWHWDGNSWTMHQVPTGYMWGKIMGVWSLGPNETYIAVDESNYSGIYKWDGVQIQTLWTLANNTRNFFGIEALSSTEVYLWGNYSYGPGLWRWNGASLEYETFAFPNCIEIRCFTAVNGTEMYCVNVESSGNENTGRKIWKGVFKGTWTVDYDFTGEPVVNGFAYSDSDLHCDRDSGFVWGVTCRPGYLQPFRQRIKSGGSWSSVDVPEHDPAHMTNVYKTAIGPGGLVRAVPCGGYGTYDDTCIYNGGSWSFYDRINGGLAASWILGNIQPTIDNIFPPDGSYVSKDTNVMFNLNDLDGTIVLSETNVWLNGNLIYSSGTFTDAWSRSVITSTSTGYHFKLVPDDYRILGSKAAFKVYTEDNDGGSAEATWSFGVFDIESDSLRLAVLRAIDFPMRFKPDCDVVLTTEKNAVLNNLKLSVMVLKHGICLMPHLGSLVPLMPFDPNDEVLKEQIASEVERAAAIGEPRAVLDAYLRVYEDPENHKISAAMAFVIPFLQESLDPLMFEVPVVKLDQ